MRPLTCEELKKHPEFDHVIWDLKPTKRETLPVAKGRGGPIEIVYEVHGHGPRKLVFIMGMGALKNAWQRQTKDFGHTQADKYSVLIFDNRGIGESEKPIFRYSTSEMARDTLEICDHLGWVDTRSLHIVGVSMGGMISQELALIAPERIASLNLVSTCAALVNTTGWWENLMNRLQLFIPKSIDTQVEMVKHNLYSDAFLSSPDRLESVVQPFPTAGDRAAAYEMHKRTDAQNYAQKSVFLHALAAGWHYKSKEQLRRLAEVVGRDRMLVMHGTEDRMISFKHLDALMEGLNDGVMKEEEKVKCEVWRGQGHVVPIEEREKFRDMVELLVDKWQPL